MADSEDLRADLEAYVLEQQLVASVQLIGRNMRGMVENEQKLLELARVQQARLDRLEARLDEYDLARMVEDERQRDG